MRDRRLLGMAVLAVTFAFAAAASADIAVTTLIIDANGDANTWHVRLRMWGDDGPGVEASSLGALDFVYKPVTASGTWVVGDANNVAPATLADPGGGAPGVPAGFYDFFAPSPDPDSYGISGKQPTDYAPDGMNDPLMDQFILPGIGKEPGSWTPPAGYTAPDLTWTEADTLLAEGTYDPCGGAGSLGIATFGRESFSMLPDTGGAYVGPTNDVGESSWVSAVVTQVMVGGNGNDGANQPYYYVGTTVTVEDGTYLMGKNAGAPGMAYVHAAIAGRPDTGIALDSNQDLLSLTIDYAAAGDQGLDLNSPAGSKAYYALRIYAPDDANRAVVEQAVLAAIVSAENSTSGVDGIFDSGMGAHASSAIGFTDKWMESAVPVVLVRATRRGDADCTGTVDLDDFLKLAGSFGQGGGVTWDQGDFNRDDVVDLDDFLILAGNFGQSYAPEPGTIALLGLGGILAVLRRRRR